MEDVLDGLLEKLAQAEAIWYASVRPDGRPHLAPVWHVWHANAVWIVTKQDAVRARNLKSSCRVAISLQDPMNALILEGDASESPEAIAEIRPLFQAKYSWDIATDSDYQVVICVTPTRLMAWGSHGDGRWRMGVDGWEAVVRK